MFSLYVNLYLPISLSFCLFYAILVLHQRYDLEVQNPGGFIGSNVIIKCIIPQFVKDYVRVTSWLEEPLHNIYPSLEGGKQFLVYKFFYCIFDVRNLDLRKSHSKSLSHS